MLKDLQLAHAELNGSGFPSIRVLRVRSPFETAQKLQDLMQEALGSRSHIAPAALRPAAAEQRRMAVLPAAIAAPHVDLQRQVDRGIASSSDVPLSVAPVEPQ